MKFEEEKFWEKLGEKMGFVAMYLVFTAVAYFLFKVLDKLPEGWNYLYIMPFTMSIVLLGILLLQLFKL